MFNDVVICEPGSQLLAGQLGVGGGLARAQLVVRGDVRVDLRHARQPHGQRAAVEVLEGQG